MKLQTLEQLLGRTNLADSVKDILSCLKGARKERKVKGWGRGVEGSFFGEREEAG